MIITVDPDNSFHERVTSAVGEAPWARAAFHVNAPEEAPPVVAAHAEPAVVVIGPHVSIPAATTLTARLSVAGSPTFVLIVTEPTTDVLRQAMRAGARDVLAPSFDDDELRSAIDRTGLSQFAGGAVDSGLTVAVFSAKGGVGTSTVAANLVTLLADRTGSHSLLIDLDVASADQAIMHALTPQWTLQELADGTIGLDGESLAGVLIPVAGANVSILPGPLDPALAETISGDAASRIIGAARMVSPVLVLDTSSAFDDRTLAAIDAADVVVVVSSLDVAALRALTVSLQTLSRIGVDPAAIRLALVRADSKSGLQVADVERSVGRDVDARIPSSRDVVRSVNDGVPLAVSGGRSGFVRAIDELVDTILPAAPAQLRAAAEERASSGGGGWFSLGRGGRGNGSRSSDGRPSSRQPSPTGAQPAAPPPTSGGPQDSEARASATVDGTRPPGEDPIASEAAADVPSTVAVDDAPRRDHPATSTVNRLDELPPPGSDDEAGDDSRRRFGRWR